MQAKRQSRRLIAGVVAILLLLSTMVSAMLAQGYWNEANAVHIKADDIESSTLVIGTHLIHLPALTDAVYDIAQSSAEESSQTEIYYKSELADNAWFNITAASTLTDITTGGSPVDDTVIEALFFTHHTKSDKVTYDLRTGQPVNIFNIRSPYALESLDEVAPLKMHYDLVKEAQGENDVTARIDTIWKTPIAPDPEVESTKAVAEHDKSLADLQVYLDVLNANDGGSAEIGAVTGVMEAVDAGRRYEVFTIVEKALEEYMDELGSKPAPKEEPPAEEAVAAEGAAGEGAGGGGSTETAPAEGAAEEEAAGGGKEVDPDLLSAVTESLSNVQNALITYSGIMLDEGTTVISSARYRFSKDLIGHASATDHAACDEDVRSVIALDNILNNVISNRTQEMSLLGGALLAQASSAYTGALWQGENGTYRAAVAKKSAQVLLDSIANENTGNTNAKRNELEFLIEAKCMRMDTQAAIEYIDQLLALTTGTFATAVPDDAFADGAKASVDAHIEFLSAKRRALELSLGGNDMDKLAAEKAALQDKRLAALDQNDLAGAKALEAQIADKESQLRGMEQETAAQLTALGQDINDLSRQLEQAKADGDASKASALDARLSQAKADRSQLENGLSDGSLGALVAQMKKSGLDAIGTLSGDGNDAGAKAQLSSSLDGLNGLLGSDSSLVLPALQELHDAMATQQALNNSAFGDGLAAIEQAILDNPDAYASAMRQERNGNDLQALFDAFAAENDLDPFGDLTFLVALQLYYDETGNSAALQLLSTTARRLRNEGNALVFERINDGTGDYLPLSAIQALTGRRHVWNKNQSMGVLAQGADYYGFTLYDTRVLRDREGTKTEHMARAAKYLGGIHIPEEYTYISFGVQALYLSGGSLGCVYNDTIMAQAEELLALFLA